MKVLGKKLGHSNNHKSMGRKLMNTSTLGRKMGHNHTHERHQVNNDDKPPQSDLEKSHGGQKGHGEFRAHTEHISGINIHRHIPLDGQNFLRHQGHPDRHAHQRHKHH